MDDRVKKALQLLDAVKACIVEHPIVGKWITEILERAEQTELNCSEKPNNCEELNAYRKCVESRSFWDNKHCDGCYFDERCPFDCEPQTDCDDRYALRTDSGEVVAYSCPLSCEQTDCPWK